MGSRCPRCNTANSPRARRCSNCNARLHDSAHILSTGRLTRNYILRERYRIISLLDIGGMGAVYKAVDLQSNDQTVAIKEMSKAKFTPREAEIRFKNEAFILENLDIPIYRAFMIIFFIEGIGTSQWTLLRVKPCIGISIRQ